MSEDARYRTKVYLETYLDGSNLTADDGSTQVKYIVMYANPDYPLERVFIDRYVDLIYAIDQPDSKPLLGHDQTPYGYEEHVPITIWTIDKIGISGVKLFWKAEAELRRITENFPFGSLRTLDRRRPNTIDLGSTKLYSAEFILNYRRAV